MAKIEPGLAAGELFDAILDAAVDSVVVIDPEGRIRRCNRATELLFGYASEELEGRNVSMLMPEPYRSHHDEYIGRYLGGQQPRIIGIGREVLGLRKDGSLFPMDLSVGEGEHQGERLFVGLMRDISERKQLESNLRRREQELRLILDSATVATATTDMDGHFLETNRACSRMLGYDTRELLARSLRDVTHPEDLPRLDSLLAALAAGRQEINLERHRWIASNGEIRFGSLHVAAVRGDSGGSERLVVQVVDRTGQIEAERREKEYRERLAHIDRLSTLGEMAAGIAHEVNQPLGAISNYAQACSVLLEKGTDPERLAEILGKISNQAQRAGEVIRRLRALARGREGERVRLDVNDLVLEVSKLAEVDARLEGVKIDIDLSDGLPPVFADPVQIQQVVLNLMRNGMDSMKEQPCPGAAARLDVATEAVEEDVVVSVRDRGAGIAAEVEERIMSPFFTTKDAGMGMGLAISQSIVASHGGRLWFSRNQDGPGVTFHLALPRLP